MVTAFSAKSKVEIVDGNKIEPNKMECLYYAWC